MLYEFSSASANNGSGFEGLGDNTVPWNVATGLVMLLARYIPIILPLAIAGLARRQAPRRGHAGTLGVEDGTFGIMLIATILVLRRADLLPGGGARPDRRTPHVHALASCGARPWHSLIASLRLVVATMLVCVVGYSLRGPGRRAAASPTRAEGSLIAAADGQVVGSRLIAQSFTEPRYFWPRPSAAGADGYDAMPRGQQQVADQPRPRPSARAALIARYGASAERPLPAELAAASGSGLDPAHQRAGGVLPGGARGERARPAAVGGRGADRAARLRAGRPADAGALVNVLELNLALDALTR